MKKRRKIGTRIKRTFILILVLAAAGSVSYFGYLQFQLPRDTYGAVFTKYTGDGWNHDVVKPGEFRFEWQGLIPTNLSIEKFVLKPIVSRITIDGSLPSADIYSMYLEGRPDFSYSYSFDIVYTVKADSLAVLASEHFLREENYADWLHELETGLSSDAVNYLRRMADNPGYMKSIAYNYRLIESDMIDDISAGYDYLDIISFIPVDIRFPDLALYEEGRRQYFEVEKFKSDIEKASREETASRLVEEAAKLDLLERYGAVFSKYPELINYYNIFRDDGAGMIPSIELPELSEDGNNPPSGQQLMRGSN